MIDIFNFKKYFRRTGDNAVAKIGHVNSVLPLVLDNDPITLGLVAEFPGQIAVDTSSSTVWVANNGKKWRAIELVPE